jgi:subfamily B ATP-binding cassette protein MsbA
VKTYFKTLFLLKPHKFLVAGGFVCMILLALATGWYVYLIGPFFRLIFTTPTVDKELEGILGFIYRFKNPEAIFLFLLVASAALRGVASFGHHITTGILGQNILRSLRDKMYERLVFAPVAQIESYPRGDIISRFTTDALYIETSVTHGIFTIIKESLQIAILITVVFYLNFKLAFLGIICIPLITISVIRIGRYLKQGIKRALGTIGILSNIVEETARGFQIHKAFESERFLKLRFSKYLEDFYLQMKRMIFVRSLFFPLVELFSAFALVGILWYSIGQIKSGYMVSEEVVSFFAAMVMLYRPIRNLSQVNILLQTGIAAGERIFKIFDLPKEEEKKGKDEIKEVKDEIRFEGIYFKYNKEIILKNFNLTISRGQIVALVGASGVGKTTIINLLCRFREPDKGKISFDQVDISQASLSSVRRQISLVTQDPILFNDTIWMNIAWGNPNRDLEEIKEAAKKASAHEFISSLPQGYNTVIGQDGISLSGGERQRICLARAILKDTPILILDEPLSSVDASTEKEVLTSIWKLSQDKIILIVAHRLSFVKLVHKVAVLKDGQIIEQGSPEELLKKGGDYFHLYKS